MSTHYDTLGVAENATQDEIKKAYKTLAKKYHPDLNNGDLECTEKFKAISSAFDAISDENKRKQYDHERKFGNQFNSSGFGGFHAGMTPEDLFSAIFGQRVQTKNRDIGVRITIDLTDAYHGKKANITFGGRNPIAIDIPPGVHHGTRMRYQGHGDKTNQSLPPGDLLVDIMINDHPAFDRHNDSLIKTVELSSLEAIVGITLPVQCIDGTVEQVKIPAGTNYNDQIIVPNKGMPIKNSKQYGDMIIIIELKTPTNLDPTDLEKIKQMLGNITPK
jgi:curved DNA-binding protein